MIALHSPRPPGRYRQPCELGLFRHDRPYPSGSARPLHKPTGTGGGQGGVPLPRRSPAPHPDRRRRPGANRRSGPSARAGEQSAPTTRSSRTADSGQRTAGTTFAARAGSRDNRFGAPSQARPCPEPTWRPGQGQGGCRANAVRLHATASRSPRARPPRTSSVHRTDDGNATTTGRRDPARPGDGRGRSSTAWREPPGDAPGRSRSSARTRRQGHRGRPRARRAHPGRRTGAPTPAGSPGTAGDSAIGWATPAPGATDTTGRGHAHLRRATPPSTGRPPASAAMPATTRPRHPGQHGPGGHGRPNRHGTHRPTPTPVTTRSRPRPEQATRSPRARRGPRPRAVAPGGGHAGTRSRSLERMVEISYTHSALPSVRNTRIASPYQHRE